MIVAQTVGKTVIVCALHQVRSENGSLRILFYLLRYVAPNLQHSTYTINREASCNPDSGEARLIVLRHVRQIPRLEIPRNFEEQIGRASCRERV